MHKINILKFLLPVFLIATYSVEVSAQVGHAVEPVTIAVFGASGRVGSRIVAEALSRGHRVTGIGRNPDNIAARHENLTVARGDVTDPEDVRTLVAGHDVVISAASGRDPAVIDPMLSIPMRAAESLVSALRALGEDAPRVLVIGGGSTTLDETLGVWFDDPEDIPEGPRGIQMLSHRLALEYLRRSDDVKWTFVAPALTMSPGERTGKFRVGPGVVIRDAQGNSAISMEDMAVAIVDEIEEPNFIRSRFTAAY